MSFAFNEAYYLKSKLQQLIKTDAATYSDWSTAQVKQAILDAGFADVQDHYNQYSLVEGTSANPYFNTTEYLEAKLAQLKSVDPGQYGNWDVADVVKAFQDAGFTNVEDHYNLYGCKETDADGKLINPSNAFDANAYVAAKLAQLQATDPENWGSDKTAQDVLEAITDAGMTPIDHFEQYGEAEGEAAGIDMVQTVPVVERVANDELRDAMGENVPSNYNPATAAPKNVTEGTSVAKPCDMGDSSTVKPEEPVATPADDAYVAVPGGGIKDTNENPVVLVSETVKNAAGEDVTVANYGVTQDATKDANGNTVQTVAPVDDKGQVAADADPIVKTTTDPTGNQTVETKMEDANGNKIEKTSNADKDGNVTAENTKADFADGSSTEVAKAVTTDPSTGYTTTSETTAATDKDGKTTTTEHSESVSPSGNETITTDKTTNPDGTAKEETKTVTQNDDGTTTTKDSVKETAADGTSTEKTTTETQNAAGEQVGDKTEVTTERNADGAISKQETTTTDTSGESKSEDTTEQAQKDDPDTPDPDEGGGSSSGGTGSPDVTGPVLKSVEVYSETVDGETKVDINKYVLTFDENVKTVTGITYSQNGGADTAVSSAEINGKVVTVTTSGLAAGDSVTFKVGTGVTDSLGNNSKVAVSDPVTVPQTATDVTATFAAPTLTVEGATENDVVIDDTAHTIKDGEAEVTPTGAYTAAAGTFDVKGLQAASIAISPVGTTVTVNTSDLSVTTVDVSAANTALTVGGNATKAAQTVVTEFATGDSVTGTGSFTVGNGGLEVTHATVEATDANTLTLTTQSDTVVKGAVAGAMDGATALVVSGTNKIDLTGITDLGTSVATLDISGIKAEAKVTSDQLAGLTTVTGANGDTLVVAGKATVDAAKLGAYTVKSEQKGGTIEVTDASSPTTIAGATIDDSFTGLTVASGATATLDAAALTQFGAKGGSIGGEGTIATDVKVTDVSLGAGTVDLAEGTLKLADKATLTAAGTLNLGTLDLSEAGTFTLATGTSTAAKAVTIGKLTGKDDSGPATAVTVTGEGEVAVTTAMSNVTSITGDKDANTFVIKGQDGLAVDMAAEDDSLTLDVAGLTLTKGISVTMGDGVDSLSLSGTHTGGVTVNLGVRSDPNDLATLGDNADTITGFVAGAAGDKLVFAKDSVDAISAVGALADLTVEGAKDFTVVVANANIVKTADGTLSAVTVGTEGKATDAAEVVMVDKEKAYILTTAGENSDGSTTYNVYNVQTDTTATIDLVGVVTVTDDLDAANFGVAKA